MDARRQRVENPNSNVVAETMKLLAKSSYSKLFKRLDHITDQLHEVQLVKPGIEHREPKIVGFLILQYAKQRMLELYFNFFKKFCSTDKYEELEMDSDALYLILSEETLEDVILPEKRAEWDKLRSKDCIDNFTANATDNFSPELVVIPTRKMIRESWASSKRNLGVQICCVSVAKFIVVMISKPTNTSLAAEDPIKEHWKVVVMVDQCQNITKCWRNLLM